MCENGWKWVKMGENTDKWELPTISRKRVYNHHTMKCTNQLTSAFFGVGKGRWKPKKKKFPLAPHTPNWFFSLGLLPDLYFSLMQNFKSSVSGILVNSFSHVIPFSRCRWLQFLVERWGTDFLFLGNPGVLSLLVRFSPPHVSLVISYRPFDKSSIFCLPGIIFLLRFHPFAVYICFATWYLWVKNPLVKQ